ncbi:MAG: squalene/phytoene synthase family protein [Terrimicrobiaceae bacterium]
MPALPIPWDLLKRVARSFFLTLRFLPHQVRDPIALAYLLARLSDTEADGAANPAEQELLARKSEIEALLLRSPDRAAIDHVWKTIQEGQDFDKHRFVGSASEPLSAEERDRYTYLVAGCVGEFWTKICEEKIPGFATRNHNEMLTLGIDYGRGLQLVNILRDRAKDAKMGRVYVSDDEIPATLAQARRHLAAASHYIHAIRPWRLRTATALPYHLAIDTLRLIEANPQAESVKIPRSKMWCYVLKAALTTFSTARA